MRSPCVDGTLNIKNVIFDILKQGKVYSIL